MDDRIAMRDEIVTRGKADIESLAALLIASGISLDEWGTAFEGLVLRTLMSGYVLGRGGIEQMTDEDFDILLAEVQVQLAYAHRFRRDIELDMVSDAQLTSRATSYAGSAIRMYELAFARAHVNLRLPAYPGETECSAGCRCHWDIQETADTWVCTWVLDSFADHCGDGSGNAGRWSPLTVSKISGDIVSEMPV